MYIHLFIDSDLFIYLFFLRILYLNQLQARDMTLSKRIWHCHLTATQRYSGCSTRRKVREDFPTQVTGRYSGGGGGRGGGVFIP
ncbi:hypothetical protein BDW66DRAFT_138836 [Aspergillus desertorum]